MPRIRTVKPEFFESEDIGSIDPCARLLFICLWGVADDYGNSRGALPYLSARAFAYDDFSLEQVDDWLQQLIDRGLVEPYRIDGDPTKCLHICKWSAHQRIQKPSEKRVVPAYSLRVREESGSPTVPVVPLARALPEQGTGNKEQGTGKKERAVVTFASLSGDGDHVGLLAQDTKRASAARVFVAWCEAWGLATHTQLTAKRERIATKALGHSSEADLLAAVAGMRRDPWEDRHKHNDFDKLLDTRDRVEMWLRNNGVRPAAPTPAPEPERVRPAIGPYVPKAYDWFGYREKFEETRDAMAKTARLFALDEMATQDADPDVRSWAREQLEREP